ncbi:MAG: hypothetical protein ABJA49_12240 [Betaproteobacteria bacterium]
MTQTLLIRNARCIATFDAADPALAQELRDASVLVQGNRIVGIGPASELPQSADDVIDARGHLVTCAGGLHRGERPRRGAPGSAADRRTRATGGATQHFGASSGRVRMRTG